MKKETRKEKKRKENAANVLGIWGMHVMEREVN